MSSKDDEIAALKIRIEELEKGLKNVKTTAIRRWVALFAVFMACCLGVFIGLSR